MNIILMRHGEASWAGSSDEARELNEIGIRQVQEAAGYISKLGPDRVLASPYVRAQQTASYITKLCPGIELETVSGLTPNADPVALLDGLPNQGMVVLVSHMPLVGRLHGLLAYGEQRSGRSFDTAMIVQLEMEWVGVGLATEQNTQRFP